jgi:hypothetical protein
MIKVEWLAAKRLTNPTKRRIGRWSNTPSKEFANPANEKQGTAALNNRKQENFDQLYADYPV